MTNPYYLIPKLRDHASPEEVRAYNELVEAFSKGKKFKYVKDELTGQLIRVFEDDTAELMPPSYSTLDNRK